jgi:hypothetical protein
VESRGLRYGFKYRSTGSIKFRSDRKLRGSNRYRIKYTVVVGTFKFWVQRRRLEETIRSGSPMFSVGRGVEYVPWVRMHGSVVPRSRRCLGSCSEVGPVVWIVVGLGSRPRFLWIPTKVAYTIELCAKLKLFANMLRKVGCGSGKRLHCARWNVGNDNELWNDPSRPERSPFISRS